MLERTFYKIHSSGYFIYPHIHISKLDVIIDIAPKSLRQKSPLAYIFIPIHNSTKPLAGNSLLFNLAYPSPSVKNGLLYLLKLEFNINPSHCQLKIPYKNLLHYILDTDWLKKCRRLCEYADGPRGEYRLLQLEMAFKCFAKKLPEPVRKTLEPIYAPL